MGLFNRAPVVIDNSTGERVDDGEHRGSEDNGVRWRGFHVCPCGVYSTNTDYILPGSSVQTNSLCVHYLAYHRADVDKETLEFVDSLTDGEAEPSEDELQTPTRR